MCLLLLLFLSHQRISQTAVWTYLEKLLLLEGGPYQHCYETCSHLCFPECRGGSQPRPPLDPPMRLLLYYGNICSKQRETTSYGDKDAFCLETALNNLWLDKFQMSFLMSKMPIPTVKYTYIVILCCLGTKMRVGLYLCPTEPILTFFKHYRSGSCGFITMFFTLLVNTCV